MDNPQGKVVGFVSSSSGRCAVVAVDAAEACPRCAAGKGCGAGIFTSSGKTRRIEVPLMADQQLNEGDIVGLELAAREVLHASWIVYGLPLAGAAIAAASAYLLGFGDAGTAVLALVGLAAGFQAGRRRLRRVDCLEAFTPVITDRLTTGD